MFVAALPWRAFATAVVVCSMALPLFAQEAPPSQCVQCHTDVKKLIRLGWEVEKVRGKPEVSAENEGEG
jgi:hypothetical protein